MKITSYKKNNKTYYKFQIRLGEKNTTRSNFKTRNEAIYAYNQLLENQEEIKKGNISYKEIYKDYLKIYQTKVKESTYNATINIYKIHILPVFGNIKIKDITVKSCQKFALSLKNYVKGKEFFNHAKRVMTYAQKMQYIRSNPFNSVILPNFKKGQKKIDFLHANEVKLLLDNFKDNQYWLTLFRLMIYTGIRRGETLALTWQDIDFKKGILKINKSLSVGKNYKTVLSTTKTYSSLRNIDLDKQTLLELKKLKLQSQTKLIFPNLKGEYNRLSNISDKLKKACSDLNIKEIRVHDLRHTHASLLFASGADMKYVQQRLGHSDIQTTMNIYTLVT